MIACDNPCETCQLPLSDWCATCMSESPYFVPDTGTCVSSCSPPYTVDEAAKTCLGCDPTCSTCSPTVSTDCYNCKSSYPYYWTESKKCSAGNCPDGSYLSDVGQKLCSSCHDSCKTCSGPNSNQCLSCKNLAYYLIESLGTCQSASCPLDLFQLCQQLRYLL